MDHSNRLQHETSPYLLQHAHNPVDWYPWGPEALARARAENKPILVSIGYSACHWCHVMERESFEDPDTARLMNDHFINIKIDREERPDLDHIYMDAVQAMTGSGGWPLNVFLTPDTRPFYGGTYFPPARAFNRPSWTEVLQGVISGFRDRRHEIDSQAGNLTAHLLQANAYGQAATVPGAGVFNTELVTGIFGNLMKSADTGEGGFGRAPKFPQSFSIQFLLRYYHCYKDPAALAQARLSLDCMIRGGIYDQLGGGFARYATDNSWLVPHFEKMLYDNALLLSVIAEAYQLTGAELYRETLQQTLGFLQRELLSPEGGFYSALDADSEGEEGRFYTWDQQEVLDLLGPAGPAFCRYYGIREGGNWEGRNILHILPGVAAEPGLGAAELEKCRQTLFTARSKRVRPGLDDKILLAWNALACTACCKAYSATGIGEFKELAVRNMDFMLQNFEREGRFYHSYKAGEARHPAFLDDLACLVQALIQLQEITSESNYLLKAAGVCRLVERDYSEASGLLFYFTAADQQDVIVRKKEIYDGATPSGNALMAGNLRYLGLVFDNARWRERSAAILASMAGIAGRYPGSFGVWASELLGITEGWKEIVVTGGNFNNLLTSVLNNFIPFRVIQSAQLPHEGFPLLADKAFSDPPRIYLCENYSCKQPLFTLSELLQELDN